MVLAPGRGSATTTPGHDSEALLLLAGLLLLLLFRASCEGVPERLAVLDPTVPDELCLGTTGVVTPLVVLLSPRVREDTPLSTPFREVLGV
jgi:hypothetical protein